MARCTEGNGSLDIGVPAPNFDPLFLLPGSPNKSPEQRNHQEALPSRHTRRVPLTLKIDVHDRCLQVTTLKAASVAGQRPLGDETLDPALHRGSRGQDGMIPKLFQQGDDDPASAGAGERGVGVTLGNGKADAALAGNAQRHRECLSSAPRPYLRNRAFSDRRKRKIKSTIRIKKKSKSKIRSKSRIDLREFDFSPNSYP
jgi:hypothetical protein